MDDYNDFYKVYEVEIEDWCHYWSPNYFFITQG